MNSMGRKVLLALVVTGLIAGCESGDIVISPTTVDNSVDNSGSGGGGDTGSNPCASYTNASGQTLQGTYDGTDCTYSRAFVDAGNNLMTDITFSDLPDDGVHVFAGSLFVGESYDNDADMAAAGISEGGDGPTINLDAGVTFAFSSESEFMVINRGSQIFAVGTATNPITFTSLTDVLAQRGEGTLDYNAIRQWGGMVINGFGISNKCAYTGALAVDGNGRVTGQGTLAAAGECHIDAEGAEGLYESQYGGANHDDSSGRLEYVRVKHTGAEVANGDELNGISFGGVGKGTVLSNIQVYSTYDDGIEFFGGSADISNYVAVYVRDDSVDLDEGYSGTMTNILVIQDETTGAHCIESDGIGSYDDGTAPGLADIDADILANINSRPTISNMTCILSGESATDNDPHDAGTGWRLREGIFPHISDSLLVMVGPDSADTNYCLRIDNRSRQAADDGDLVLTSNIFGCLDRTNGGSLPSTTTVEAFAAATNQFPGTFASDYDPTAAANTDWVVLEGSPLIYSVDFATMQIDSAAPTVAAPVSGQIGALTMGGVDWTEDWTYGIHDGLRAVPLWYE